MERGKKKKKKRGNCEGKRYANMMTSSMREEKAEREEKQERSHIKHRGRKCTIRIPVQKKKRNYWFKKNKIKINTTLQDCQCLQLR